MYDTTARSDQSRRPRAGALVARTAATAAVGAGMLAALPPTGPVGWPVTERHDVTLADYTGTTTPTPNIWDGIVALVDASGIGAKTLPDFLPVDATLKDVLNPSGLTLSTPLNPTGLWDLLGLQNFTVADVLTDLGLDPSMTVDQLADKWQMTNVPIDFFATPLGIPSTQTTMGLAHRFSIAHETLDDLVKMGGFQPNETLQQMLTQLNLWNANIKPITFGPSTLGGLVGLAGLAGSYCSNGTGITAGTTIDGIIACLNYDGIKSNPHLTGSTTVQQILDSQHFNTTGATTTHTNEIIGNWTIGQILNFSSSTTIGEFVDNLHVNFGVTADGPGTIPTNPVTPPSTTAPSGNTPATNVGATIADSTHDQGSTAVPSGSQLSVLPTLGSKTIGELMAWIGVPTSQTIAHALSTEIYVGSTPLGNLTIGDALDSMLLNPTVLPGYPTTILTPDTPLTLFFTAMGGPLATETIDQLLHISP